MIDRKKRKKTAGLLNNELAVIWSGGKLFVCGRSNVFFHANNKEWRLQREQMSIRLNSLRWNNKSFNEWRAHFIMLTHFMLRSLSITSMSLIFVLQIFLLIVCKGGHGGFSKFLFFLEIQDVSTFYSPIMKTKVLNHSFNWFLHDFDPQSILILEEYLQKWWNANLISP